MVFLRYLSLAVLTLSPIQLFADKLVVQTPSYPLFYFAERVATDSFDVQYRVSPGVDPAFWKPGNDDLVAFQQADIVLRNGAKYSKWMHYASLSSSRIVDTTREVRDQFIKTKGEMHSHGDGTVHSHGGIAFTTWLDFNIAKVQANSIARRFRAMKPAEAGAVDKKLQELMADLSELDKAAKEIGRKLDATPLVASHSVYQYFSRAYGLKVKTLDWEPTMEIGPKQEAELQKLLATHPAKTMIWEAVPAQKNIDKLKELGLTSIVISPTANRPGKGDFLTAMKANLEALASIVSSQ